MSGSVAHRKRLVRVTAENLRRHDLPLNEHIDFFQTKEDPNISVEILPDGSKEPFETKIDARGGGVISGTAIEEFYRRRQIRAGDVLAFEKVGPRKYRLYPFDSKNARDDSWRQTLELPLTGTGPTVLELFAGCGGMALGFKNAGYRTALAVEWDEAACETLRINITDRVAHCAIQEIDRFPRADVVAGGPPCQGFSNLGERVPEDPRNQLWRHFLRAVEDALPKVFVMENVPPLLASREYAEIVKHAESLGYRVEGRVLNAADYGVPQTRKRAIVIGARGFAPTYPEPTHVSAANVDGSTDRLPCWKTVREAIGDLPFTPSNENWHLGRNPTAMSLERYRHVPPGGNRRDLPPHLMPECWKRKVKGGTDLFGRLWWERPSVTIRTEFYKPEKGRYLHPEADRPITHREAARLQGFPDDFAFRGKKIQVGVQIGNACPPLLAEAIARHIMIFL